MSTDPNRPIKPSPIGLAVMAAGMVVIGIALVIMGFVRGGWWWFGIPVGVAMIYAGFKTALKS